MVWSAKARRAAAAARRKKAGMRSAISADKAVRKGTFGTGKTPKKVLVKIKTKKGKASQKSWDRDRYNREKVASVIGVAGIANKKSTRFGVAKTSTGKKITKPVFKKRKRR
jgi:hypothetical protein